MTRGPGRKSRCNRSFASGAGRLEYYDRGEAKRKLTPAPVVLQDEFRLRQARVRDRFAAHWATLMILYPDLANAVSEVESLLDQNPGRSFSLCDPHDASLEIASGELSAAAFLR